jgi:hypothetical protein
MWGVNAHTQTHRPARSPAESTVAHIALETVAQPHFYAVQAIEQRIHKARNRALQLKTATNNRLRATEFQSSHSGVSSHS